MGSLDVSPLAAGTTDTSRHRERNEDRFGVFPDLGLFVVVDGMSGASGSGEVVAKIAVDVMREHFEATRDAHAGAHRLAEAVRLANRRVLERTSTERWLSNGACTLVALALDAEGVHVTHVGDSRVYRLVGEGLEQLTEDHSLLADAHCLGISLPTDVPPETFAKILVRAVGMQEDVVFEVQTFAARPRDVYLLSTDGLHDFVPPDEMAAVIRANPDLDAAVQGLLGRAIHHDAADNITCVLVVPHPG
ncbi:PP2C family protein-serine/threonine phosphatase [Polyangium mundeleinium]|uniref:Protein phosphatase 2C domain-containing protein n=1 Tax=Polyangium mundeleinium TaxID=2995306 RepID=A0ABT5ESY0_9BACT|nr:protein phosphatase 2C domain-containing protein [Polyangium mundeleinium]MDC0744928.1 protein phosphatase 2C domain-containing protein [Polyangium mundeleinium]